MEEAPLSYHIVLTLHNARTSQRMRQFKVFKESVKYLSLTQEIELTRIFKSVINELKLKCYAYNVCKDHVHLIIQCKEEDLVETIRKLKGKTAYLYNRATGSNGPFWSQKFFMANLDDWSITIARPVAFSLNSSYFLNAVAYIKDNRIKHDLPESDVLNRIIGSFVSRVG